MLDKVQMSSEKDPVSVLQSRELQQRHHFEDALVSRDGALMNSEPQNVVKSELE